jgi:hypothetical protein
VASRCKLFASRESYVVSPLRHTVTEGRQSSLFEGIPTAHPTLRKYTRPITVVAVKIQGLQSERQYGRLIVALTNLSGTISRNLRGKRCTVSFASCSQSSMFKIFEHPDLTLSISELPVHPSSTAFAKSPRLRWGVLTSWAAHSNVRSHLLHHA